MPSLVKWFKYYASVIRVEDRPVVPTSGKLHNWVDRVAIGVIAQITPFNHPLLIATKKIAPALAAGNCIVLKPSELTPITSILLGKLFKDAGLPDGVFNVVPGYGLGTGKTLVEHPLVDKIDVTVRRFLLQGAHALKIVSGKYQCWQSYWSHRGTETQLFHGRARWKSTANRVWYDQATVG